LSSTSDIIEQAVDVELRRADIATRVAANRLGAPTGMTIEQTLRSLGVKWLRTVRSYSVAKMTKTLKEAMRTVRKTSRGDWPWS
jgi:TPP-dependent indolepyruvate ferredoxin oxidoreductase alpha subunit